MGSHLILLREERRGEEKRRGGKKAEEGIGGEKKGEGPSILRAAMREAAASPGDKRMSECRHMKP